MVTELNPRDACCATKVWNPQTCAVMVLANNLGDAFGSFDLRKTEI